MPWTRLLIVLPLACLGCIPENDPPAAGVLTLRPQEALETRVASRKRSAKPNPLAQRVPGAAQLPAPIKPRDPSQVDPQPRPDPAVDPNKRVPRLPHVTVPDVRGNRPRPRRTYGPDPILERLKALGSDKPNR